MENINASLTESANANADYQEDDQVQSVKGGSEVHPIDAQEPEDERAHPEFEEEVKKGRAIRDEIYKKLGVEVTLVPYFHGTKVAVLRSVMKANLAVMDSPKYLAALGKDNRNTGVLTGLESENVVSIDFDSQEDLDLFLNQNPLFRETFATKGARGGNLWIRMIGDYPRSFFIKDSSGRAVGEFRAGNCVTLIRGTHPSGVQYQEICDKPPICIRWEDINWPGTWAASVDRAVNPEKHTPTREKTTDGGDEQSALFQKYGEPFTMGKLGNIRLNQVGMAELFLFLHPIKYRSGHFFVEYDRSTGVWKNQDIERVKQVLIETFVKYANEVGVPGLIPALTGRVVGEIFGLVKSRAQIDFPSTCHDKIHMKNGMLDLSVTPPVLLPHSPDFYSMVLIPFEYDPHAKCPRFLKFLHSAINDDDVVLLQKFAGMVLFGKNFAQSFLILCGCAGAGKGVIEKIVKKIIGIENCAELRTKHLEERFEKSRFIGKTLLIAPDVHGDFLNLKGAQAIKSLTGGDIIKSELKGMNGGPNMDGEFNILITTNNQLRVILSGENDRGAWERRIKMIEFTKKAEHQNPYLAEEIVETEGSGIVNWMLEGLKALREDYKFDGKWVMSEAQNERIQNLLDESDSIASFIEEKVTLGGVGDTVTSEELANGYSEYCNDMGWVAQPSRVVLRRLPDILRNKFRVNQRNDIWRGATQRRGWSGIYLERPERRIRESDSF